MNLVEAVNKMLGTDANNLQGALNEAAGTDASNITEAISNIEGGGGGGYNPPRITITNDGGLTASCDTSYEDFWSLRNVFDNTSGYVPCLFIYDGSEYDGVFWATAYFQEFSGGFISMSDGEFTFYYLPDGTITTTEPSVGA